MFWKDLSKENTNVCKRLLNFAEGASRVYKIEFYIKGQTLLFVKITELCCHYKTMGVLVMHSKGGVCTCEVCLQLLSKVSLSDGFRKFMANTPS